MATVGCVGGCGGICRGVGGAAEGFGGENWWVRGIGRGWSVGTAGIGGGVAARSCGCGGRVPCISAGGVVIRQGGAELGFYAAIACWQEAQGTNNWWQGREFGARIACGTSRGEVGSECGRVDGRLEI